MRATRVGEIQDRFWTRVEKRGPDECWAWGGTVNGKDGYGIIGGLLHGKRYAEAGKKLLAHRISWIMHNGDFPDEAPDDYHGWVVLHTCDNPRCVNPGHLRLGTQRNNVDDMHQKARANTGGLAPKFGAAHHNAVLDADKVAYIIGSTKTNGDLAAELGVHKATIKRVRCGASGYVTDEQAQALKAAAKGRKGLSRPGTKNPNAKLTAEQVKYIRECGLTTYQIAAELGIHQTTAARVRRGAVYNS